MEWSKVQLARHSSRRIRMRIPSALPSCSLVVKFFRNFPCIRIEFSDHMQGAIDFQDASHVSLFTSLASSHRTQIAVKTKKSQSPYIDQIYAREAALLKSTR